MVNYEYQNRLKLNDSKKIILDYVDNIWRAQNNTKTKRRMRRVLQGGPDQPDPETLAVMNTLNQYKVKVKKVGLNFDKYTKDDVDGFKDINATDVFSGKILAMAALWFLLIPNI